MEIQATNKKLFDINADIYVLPVFKGENNETVIMESSVTDLEKILKNGAVKADFRKKSTQVFSYKGVAKKALFIGLGKAKELNNEKIREAAGDIINDIKNSGAVNCAVSQWQKDDESGIAQLEAMLLADYSYDEFKSEKKSEMLKTVLFLTGSKRLAESISDTKKVIENVLLARNMMNAPGNKATPSFLADMASKIANRSKNLSLKILELKDIKKLGMGAFYGVAKGSDEPAKFIILEYKGAARNQKPIAIIGKGITFDSGGISIKPSEKMEDMKYDMSGAAITLAVLKTIAELKLKKNVIGFIPATENLPSGKAYKPGDILKSLSGTTIEVISTDAEGRLILADAITYSRKFKPAAIIDLATLTGACVIALGHYAIGMMGNNEELMRKMEEAGKKTGERVWQLPLFDEYRKQIKSTFADIKNTGGRDAGTITAGMFLKEFAKDTPWVHLDIAGTSYGVKEKPYIPEGASGIGVRLLVQFVKNL